MFIIFSDTSSVEGKGFCKTLSPVLRSGLVRTSLSEANSTRYCNQSSIYLIERRVNVLTKDRAFAGLKPDTQFKII